MIATAKCWQVFVLGCALGAAATSAATDAPRPRQQIYQELRQRHEAAAEDLADTQVALQRIEALLEAYRIDDTDLAKLITTLSQERDELKLTVEQLEALLAQLRKLLQVDAAAVQEALAQALAAREQLLIDEEHLREDIPPPETKRHISTAISLDGMQSRAFLLTGEAIAPFSQPYFTAQNIKVRLHDRRVVERPRYTRDRDAGATTLAVQPGGVLHELVTSPDFDRTQTYVTLWVCDDAIDSYRTAVAFLKSHGVRYTWLPDVDAPWTAIDDEAPLGNWGYDG
ncbi:hypothetical protein [Synoicihabitans lomoniglobus]|uniref:Rhodanese domain-containing protein n=1 Tax=Synoicihabitans lomoniglobus TaxID=2909285 RepID=A0AAE9ZY10_9BACT|nr:hypothetical protein [Opitutaceae bacterium LMO-M01]WED65666.1 hypothetical protein PXH66_02245 [Opitutaceae bacterium LMO-M01]